MIIQLDSKYGKQYVKEILSDKTLNNILKNKKICENLE
jgi:hypothetical protein